MLYQLLKQTLSTMSAKAIEKLAAMAEKKDGDTVDAVEVIANAETEVEVKAEAKPKKKAKKAEVESTENEAPAEGSAE